MLALFFIVFTHDLHAQIKMLSNGYIGLGTNSPTSRLHIDGNKTTFSCTSCNNPVPFYVSWTYQHPCVYPGTDNIGMLGLSNKFWGYSYVQRGYFDYITYYVSLNYSDERLKKNEESVKEPLEKVKKLKPYRYDYDVSGSGSEHDRNISDQSLLTNRYGFIAQDLLEILPELVHYDSTTSLYAVDYTGLIPILAGALQELEKKVEQLESKEKENKNMSSDNLPDPTQKAGIGQNRPNPFNEDTTIPYFLPSDTENAVFYVYDLQGKQILSRRVPERGNGEIVIFGSELQPGMYNYALIA
ncbi:MAG: tail fiber domain-containing protein, partial [Bacteroidales bacterium]|nr:tail fiber domain-containing protein [Bacteroidales bacterium]